MPPKNPEHTPPPDHVPFAQNGWKGYIHRAWQRFFCDNDPIEKTLTQKHQTIKSRPNAQVLRAATHLGEIYLKLTCAPKDHTGPLAQLKWITQPSQAVDTHRVTQQMTRQQIRTPPVVLAARRRTGLQVQELLITRAVPGQTLKAALCAARTHSEARHLATIAAQHVAALHRAGFIHGDLLTGNILVTQDSQDIVFIDNDRTHRAPPLAQYAKRRNLEQITQRLHKHGLWVARHFLSVYAQTLDLSQKDQARLQRKIIPRALHRRRLRRKAKRLREQQTTDPNHQK